ncbi:MAG: hypothetical protein HQ472_04040 [Ignavibacteria bacterium]|nr:hypothetical protein [Ignavibacteria bacterium]
MNKRLLIIPSIDLVDGHCARCIVGEPGTEQLYSEISGHPVELAQLWRRENAKCIHVTDIDSFMNRDSAANIAVVGLMQQAVDVPIEFVSFQTSTEPLIKLLESGVYRVAINASLYTEPDAVRQMLETYGVSRIVFGVRAHGGQVDLGPEVGLVSDEEFISRAHKIGGTRIIYTERDWEGTLSGEDFETIKRIADVAPMRITMAGGIASPQHLWELQDNAPKNVDSVVIGRAMFENRFPCQKIWRMVEAKLEPDIHKNASTITEQSSISLLSRKD